MAKRLSRHGFNYRSIPSHCDTRAPDGSSRGRRQHLRDYDVIMRNDR